MKKKIFFAAVALPALIALTRIDARELLESARRAPLWALALPALLQVATQALVSLQWRKAAKACGTRAVFADMLYINAQGAIIDSITPGVKFGGELARAVQITRVTGASGEQAAAIVALQKIFSLGAFFLIALLTVGLAAGYALAALIALLAIGVPVGLKIGRVRSFLLTLAGHLSSLRGRELAGMLSLSLLIWVLYPVKLYILAAQFMPEVGLHIAGAAFAAYAAAMLPIFPGGLGGFEASLTGLLAAAGFAAGDALVISLLFRFVTFWLVLLLSLAFTALAKIRANVKKERSCRPCINS